MTTNFGIPIILPEEWYDLVKILDMGAVKHGENTWLDEENPSLQLAKNCDSIFHHLSDARSGVTADHESGLHPFLHTACRSLMAYTRWKRGIDK